MYEPHIIENINHIESIESIDDSNDDDSDFEQDFENPPRKYPSVKEGGSPPGAGASGPSTPGVVSSRRRTLAMTARRSALSRVRAPMRGSGRRPSPRPRR